MSRVVVRIVRRGAGFVVIGRRTRQECATFGEAWEMSVEYFSGRRR